MLSLYKNLTGFRKNLSFYKSYKEEVASEEKKNIALKTQKLRKTSVYEVEKTIRNKLGLLRPDEIAIIIPLPSPSPTPIITPALPVYRQWLNVFFQVD